MTWQSQARRQHGVIRIDQLSAHGVTRHGLAVLRARGDLVPTGFKGVLRAAAARTTDLSLYWSAVLGTRGVLSHLSAAQLWRMEPPLAARVHVTISPTRRCSPPPHLRLHRIGLSAATVVDLDGLQVTDRATTVLDCLAVLSRAEAMTLFDRARQNGWIDLAAAAHRLDAQPGRPGNATVRWLLREAATGSARSERLLHALLRRAGIRGWRANVRIGRYEGDVVFEDRKLVIEVDGFAHHVSPDRFQADRRKQNALVAAGWTVLRFTWRDLTERPDHVARTITGVLHAPR